MESELWPALDDFEDAINEIPEVLKPLLEEHLPKHASTLPLLDKAKLYILTTYALESLLFSYIETTSTSTANHPIMKELTRIKQYFQKIRDIESKEPAKEEAKTAANHVDTRDNLVLDKVAAGRFIAAALAGNDKYDVERAENVRLQKERAKEKLGEMGEGVKDPLGERAAESSSDSEDGGVKLVTSDHEDGPEAPAEVSSKPLETTSAATADGVDEEERKRKKKEKKRKRELEAKEAAGGEKKPKKNKSKKDKKEKASKKK